MSTTVPQRHREVITCVVLIGAGVVGDGVVATDVVGTGFVRTSGVGGGVGIGVVEVGGIGEDISVLHPTHEARMSTRRLHFISIIDSYRDIELSKISDWQRPGQQLSLYSRSVQGRAHATGH